MVDKWIRVKSLLLALAFIVALNTVSESGSEKKIAVFVSIEPQAYFVERIGGDLVEVGVLVPPGKSPATYAPKPEQMVDLAKADLFFRIGVPFEDAFMPKIESHSSSLVIIDTRQGIRMRHFEEDPPKKHGIDEANHSHEAGGADPHIWMSPKLVIRQGKTICDALSALAPEYEARFKANFESFTKDLVTVDEKIQQMMAPFKDGTVFVFHPVFGYFADAYGLKQVAVEHQGKAPKGKDLAAFISLARTMDVHVIFVQPQFDDRAARKIAASINGAVIPIDPLARDYIHNLEQIAVQMNNAFLKE